MRLCTHVLGSFSCWERSKVRAGAYSMKAGETQEGASLPNILGMVGMRISWLAVSVGFGVYNFGMKGCGDC